LNKNAAKKMKIFAISGSLRPGSSASAVLRVVATLVPREADFTIFSGLGDIPPFNDSDQMPEPVKDFINRITEADAVFFCIPEYALGVPGALKNALDWTVSSIAFSFKPVALITAASGGEKAHAAFLLTLTALGTKISKETSLLISFIRTKLNEKNEVKDISTLNEIKEVIAALMQIIES
jgi:chromate reductase, NAD(P)H dehydrogenase (quinone)